MTVTPRIYRGADSQSLSSAKHLTCDGVAEAMITSPNTVKAYLESIYRKLGATKRSEAVENARAIGLTG